MAASSTTCSACASSTCSSSATPRFDGLNLTFETREGHPQALLACATRASWATWASASSTRTQPVARSADRQSRRRNRLQQPRRRRRPALGAARPSSSFARSSIFARHMEAALKAHSRPRRAAPHPRDGAAHDRHAGDGPDPLERGATSQARAPATSTRCARAPPLDRLQRADARAEQLELKRFLHRNLYRHYRVARMSSKARRIVSDLFEALHREPRLLPPEFQARAARTSPARDRRLHRGHDRPLRHARAPATVRDRSNLAPQLGVRRRIMSRAASIRTFEVASARMHVQSLDLTG